jgi:4-amino-4-deoxy-L-arabinose transferase-like glycosyltransferase
MTMRSARLSRGFPPNAQVALAFALALGVRLIGIEGRAMWYDEAFAVLFSQKGLGAMLYGTLTTTNGAAADVHPLLYYTTLDGWMRLFGIGPVAVRLYSVLLSLAALGVLYLLARRLFGHRTAIFALLIAAVAPFNVQYGQEARMYALLSLLLLCTTYCFVRGAAAARGLGWWVGFGVCAALAMYAQQLAGFYLIALGLVAVARRDLRTLLGAAFGTVIALIVYGPWLIQLPAQFGKIGAYWIARPGIPELLLTLRTFVFVDMDVPSVAALLISLVAALLAVALVLVQAAAVQRRPARFGHDRFGLLLALWLAFAPMALMWLVSQAKPVYLNRALLPSALLFYIALGWLFSKGRLPRPIALILAVALGLSAVSGMAAFASWDSFPRGAFRQVAASIQAQATAGGTGIIHANKLTAIPFAYYDQLDRRSTAGARERYIADPPGSASDTLAPATQDVLGLPAETCIQAAARDAAQVLYIKFERQGDADLPWLRAHFSGERATAYGDLTVYTFAGPDAAPRSEECPKTP